MSRADSLGEPPGRRRARRRTSPASATRSPVTSSCAPATSRASRRRAPLRRGARRLRARDDDGEVRPLLAELPRGLVPLVAAAATAAAADGRAFGGPVRGRGPAAARVMERARGRRLRSRPLAPGRLAAPVRAAASAPATSASRRATTCTTSRAPTSARCTSSATASTRRASRPRLKRTPARRPGVARRARVAEPAVGEHRRPRRPFCTWLLPLARARAPGDRRRARRGRAVPRGQPGPAEPDPRRGGRDDVQPAHRPAVRARARADRGHARRRRPPARLERGDAPAARARRPRRRPRACCRTSTGAPG